MFKIFKFPKTQIEKNIDLIKRHEFQKMKNDHIFLSSEKSHKKSNSEEDNYINKKDFNSNAKKMNDILKTLVGNINDNKLNKQQKKDSLQESKRNEGYENSRKKLNNQLSIKTNLSLLKKSFSIGDNSSINSETEEGPNCEVQEEKEFSKINISVEPNWKKYFAKVKSGHSSQIKTQ